MTVEEKKEYEITDSDKAIYEQRKAMHPNWTEEEIQRSIADFWDWCFDWEDEE